MVYVPPLSLSKKALLFKYFSNQDCQKNHFRTWIIDVSVNIDAIVMGSESVVAQETQKWRKRHHQNYH